MKKRITICIYIIFIAVISICCGLVRIRTKENNNPNSDSDNTIAESEVKNNSLYKELDINEDIFGECGNSQGSPAGGADCVLYGGYFVFESPFNNKFVNLLIDDNEKARFLCFNESCNHTGNCSGFQRVSGFQYYKGNLYGYNGGSIVKLEDNSFETICNTDSYIENFFIRNGKFYISDDKGICSIDMDNFEKKYICDIRPCVFSLNVCNDKIYFSSETFQLYSMNFDGSDLKILSEDFAFEPQLHNNILYYRDMYSFELVALNMDTMEKKIIADNSYQLIVCEDALYFLDYFGAKDEQCNLYRYIYDTEEIQHIATTYFGNFGVYDELDFIMILERIEETDEYGNIDMVDIPYLIDKDGGNKRKVELPEIINY